MKKLVLMSGILSIFSAATALAETPSFNFIEGGYSNYSINDEDGDGFVIRGSLELTNNIYIQGEATEITVDDASEGSFVNDDLDLGYQTFGIGYKSDIGENAVLFTSINYLNTESDFRGSSNSEDGYTLSAGMRSMVTDATELYGEVSHIDVNDTSTALTLGARQHLTENFGVFAEYTKLDDGEQDHYNVGVSYRF